jgi:hypothetical protein
MERQTAPTHEQRLIRVVQTLPTERVLRVVEFAEFQRWQLRQLNKSQINSFRNLESDEERKDEAEWDKQFAGSLDVLQQLADKALADHRAGKTFILDPETL